MKTKYDIAKAISEENNISICKATEVIDTMLAEMRKALKDGEGIALRGFGTFSTKESKGKYSHFTKSVLPDKKRVKFKKSKLFII